LISSLACEDAISESPTPPLVVCEVLDLQSNLIIPSANPPAVIDAPAVIIRSLTTPMVALELQAAGVGESFKSLILLPWKGVLREPLLCAPVRVLD
jgi:hypothetical protein